MNWLMFSVGVLTLGAAAWAAWHKSWDFSVIYACWAVADFLIARRG